MAARVMDVVQGTLDVLVLKGLTWGPMHGYDILGWLRRITDGELRIEDAALYPALHRLEARGLIESEWGLSANNRRAKFYELTTAGKRALRAETDGWTRYAALMARVLAATELPV
ncbi:MAG: PadR family transcriptional regulator [Gemmatirosa sp.]|nr:PadR family transcriptional regulator [Gemmatirosa sp.]